jgi:hypothetical protein
MLKNFELRLENEPIDNPSRNIKLFNHLDLIDHNCEKPTSLNKLFVVTNNRVEVHTNHMYLATNEMGEIYWVRFQFSGGFGYFKVMSKFVLDNGVHKFVREKGKNIDILNKHKYRVYEMSIPLINIPSLGVKIIRGDKKKWDDLCELVENKNIKLPISWIVNVFDLKMFISEFF